MKIKAVIFLGSFIILSSCKKINKNIDKPVTNPQKLVDSAMAVAGTQNIEGNEICFDFRGKEYISYRKDWRYRLERIKIDSLETIKDVISNEGFRRYINDSNIALPDSLAARYSNSVNSVHYFAYLPYGLNDKAVNKEFLNESVIKGQAYYVLKVTFNQENGGDDFEDVFLYWIHKEKYTVDYLAYEFHTNGGGLRFREAYNERTVNGIRFVDYKNYKPASQDLSLYQLEDAFTKGELILISQIALENIYVQPCTQC